MKQSHKSCYNKKYSKALFLVNEKTHRSYDNLINTFNEICNPIQRDGLSNLCNQYKWNRKLAPEVI